MKTKLLFTLLVLLSVSSTSWAGHDNVAAETGWYKGSWTTRDGEEYPKINLGYVRDYQESYIRLIPQIDFDGRTLQKNVRVSVKGSRLVLVESVNNDRINIDFKKTEEQFLPDSFLRNLQDSEFSGVLGHVDQMSISNIEEVEQKDPNRIMFKGIGNLYGSIKISNNLTIKGVVRIPLSIESFSLKPDPDPYEYTTAPLVTAEDLVGKHGLKFSIGMEPLSSELSIGETKANSMISEAITLLLRAASNTVDVLVVLMPNLDGVH